MESAEVVSVTWDLAYPIWLCRIWSPLLCCAQQPNRDDDWRWSFANVSCCPEAT